jgi:hypothetical protein
MDGRKWHNPEIFSDLRKGIIKGIERGVCYSLVVLALCYGVKKCNGPMDIELEIDTKVPRVNTPSVVDIYEDNLNGRDGNETYCIVGGEIFFSHIDGKNLEEKLKEERIP